MAKIGGVIVVTLIMTLSFFSESETLEPGRWLVGIAGFATMFRGGKKGVKCGIEKT